MRKQLKKFQDQWDKEFSSDKWSYLNFNSTEKARHAIIGMYCRHFFSKGRILDVGCGEGTLIDFLNTSQRKKYLGIDLSKVAINIAKKKRRAKFLCIDASSFSSKEKFDVIIFNEMLYYVNDKVILRKYSRYLRNNGVFIIFLYRTKKFNYGIECLKRIRKFYIPIESIEIKGRVNKRHITWQIEVGRKNSKEL